MLDLSDEFSGNGVAVLCVHAAIAYGDALAIFSAGKKSKSGDHKDAAPFLASSVKIQTAEDKAAMRAFQTLLGRKDEVSYMQILVNNHEAGVLLEKLQTFARWAEKTFRNLQKGI